LFVIGLNSHAERVARTADFAVRVFSVAIAAAVPYSIAVSKLRPVPSGTGLRRPFLSDRYLFIVVRLLRRREKFTEPDFALRSARTNLIAPSRGRKDADRESGGPRYQLLRF
jgi:hypothetical protein